MKPVLAGCLHKYAGTVYGELNTPKIGYSRFERGYAPEALAALGGVVGGITGYATGSEKDSALKRFAKTVAGLIIGGGLGYAGGYGLSELSRKALSNVPEDGKLRFKFEVDDNDPRDMARKLSRVMSPSQAKSTVDVLMGLPKTASKKSEDMGDGFRFEYDDKDKEAVESLAKIREAMQPKSFGKRALSALPASAIAALAGGVGSVALSRGSIGAGVGGALASGLGTMALNLATDGGSRPQSALDAVNELGDLPGDWLLTNEVVKELKRRRKAKK